MQVGILTYLQIPTYTTDVPTVTVPNPKITHVLLRKVGMSLFLLRQSKYLVFPKSQINKSNKFPQTLPPKISLPPFQLSLPRGIFLSLCWDLLAISRHNYKRIFPRKLLYLHFAFSTYQPFLLWKCKVPVRKILSEIWIFGTNPSFKRKERLK